MKKLINTTFIFLFCTACVGTIEEKNPSTTKGLTTSRAPLQFEGILKAVPIADDKVDVYFYPAVGDQKKLTYKIRYDGLVTAISVPAEILTQDRGLLKYTVRNLEIGKSYSFGVEVEDSDQVTSESNKIIPVKTFTFDAANFDGVTTGSVLPGIDGKNSIYVNWVEATRTGLDSTADQRNDDPIEYELTIIDSNQVNISDFDNDAFTYPHRRVVTTTADRSQLQVNGLSPGITYNIRVRCVHRGFINNLDNYTEQNSNYITLTTLSDTAGSIVLDSDSLNISPADGSTGRTTFYMNWSPVSGPVDHFRTYYRKVDDITTPWSIFKGSANRTGDCSGALVNDGFYCSRFEGIKTDAFVTDLEINSSYEVYHLACSTILCAEGDYQIFSSTIGKIYTTEATPAHFDGVISFSGPKFFSGLDKAYVEFTPPDLSSGAVSGLLITVQKLNFDGSIAEEYFLNHPEEDTVPAVNLSDEISFELFDYSEDSFIVLTGMDTLTLQSHCVKLTPFIDRGDNGFEYVTDLESGKCGSVRIQLPVQDDFEGLDLILTQFSATTDKLTLAWNAPSQGVFDRYRVFILHEQPPGTFSFEDAVSGDTNYYLYEVSAEKTSLVLTPIPTGHYEVGILPYLGITDEYQEDYNNNIKVFSR